jgi:hypothetical protein
MGLLARGNGLFGSPINIEEAAAACVADCTGGEGGEEVGVADLCRRPRPLTRLRLTGDCAGVTWSPLRRGRPLEGPRRQSIIDKNHSTRSDDPCPRAYSAHPSRSETIMQIIPRAEPLQQQIARTSRVPMAHRVTSFRPRTAGHRPEYRLKLRPRPER